jgi:hypothetical protein
VPNVPSDSQPDDDEVASSGFRSEIIRASTPAIYGRSWIPYLRLILLLIVLTGLIFAAHEAIPDSQIAHPTTTARTIGNP